MKSVHSYQLEVSEALQHAQQLLDMQDAIEEPKMMLSILNHIHQAQQSVVSFFLSLEGKDEDVYAEGLQLFLSDGQKHELLSEQEEDAFLKTYTLLMKEKESPVGFVRKENYAIANDAYDISLLTKQLMNELLLCTKQVSGKVFGRD